MERMLGYSLVFFLVFLVTAGVAVVTWALLEGWRWRSADSGPAGAGPEAPGILRNEMLSTLSLFALLLGKFRFVERLKMLLAEADLDWSVGRTVSMVLVAGAATLNALLSVDWIPSFAAWGGAALAAAGPLLYIRRKRAKRLGQVEEQLPEALDYLGRALVAGHSLPMSLELLADEIGAPLSVELRKTVDEYNLGLSMSEALRNLGQRLPSVDIQFFVSAVLTQSRTGGNLHELLEGLAETIRERSSLKGKVRALTANGRMTASILSLMPLLVGGLMILVNPFHFALLLAHPLGKTLLFVALAAQIAAYFVIRKIVDIRI